MTEVLDPMDQSNEVSDTTKSKYDPPVSNGASSIGICQGANVLFLCRHKVGKRSKSFSADALTRDILIESDPCQYDIHIIYWDNWDVVDTGDCFSNIHLVFLLVVFCV
jgi:hypothetical protein